MNTEIGRMCVCVCFVPVLLSVPIIISPVS